MRYHPILLFAVVLTSMSLLFQCHRNRRGPSSSKPDRSVMERGRDTMPGRKHQMMGRDNDMRGMMQRMMPDMLPPGIEPEELPDRNSRGAKLLTQYCTSCHNLPSPTMHSAEEWLAIAERMFQRMDMMGGMGMMRRSSNAPVPEEQKKIVAYLKEHALASVSEEELKIPQSEGGRLFKQTCTQCHALPDPVLHTPQEWEQVVERMREHMVTMNKEEITEQEKKKILEFLETQAH